MEAFNHFAELAEQYDQTINKLVRAAAFKIERGAKQRAAVDTGAMRASIYVRTEDTSDYGKTGLKALGRNKDVFLFPEVEQPTHNEALIAVGVSYGIFVEYGTSKMAAQPFMTPAYEAERQPFLNAIHKLIEKGEKAGIDIDIDVGG